VQQNKQQATSMGTVPNGKQQTPRTGIGHVCSKAMSSLYSLIFWEPPPLQHG